MDLDAVSRHCAALPGAREDYPFGAVPRVYKVAGKIFAFISIGEVPGSVSLKCDPTWSTVLRERYRAVTPGYHLNKKWWNSIELDGSVPRAEIEVLINRSYELVVAKLPRAEREKLDA